MNKPITEQLFDQFWKAYPARNRKKVGKYPCSLWFEAKRPSPATVEAMLNWIEQDKSNREAVERDGGFYAPPPDPIRFLRERMWTDDIGVVLNKQQREAKVRKKRSDGHQEQKVAEYIATFENIIEERTVQQLLNNKSFMNAARTYPEFRAWAIEQKPLLEGARPSRK